MADAVLYWLYVAAVGLAIGVAVFLALVVLGACVGKIMASADGREEHEADTMRQAAALAQSRQDAARRRLERVTSVREIRQGGGDHAA